MIEEEIVYVRTDEGEAKAKQPRSISSHELRAMLLLIDGRLSVRELRRRFGKSLAIDKSIGELSRLGWVERDQERDGLDLDLVNHKSGADVEAESVEESPDVAREEINREAQALAAAHMEVEELDASEADVEVPGDSPDDVSPNAAQAPDTEMNVSETQDVVVESSNDANPAVSDDQPLETEAVPQEQEMESSGDASARGEERAEPVLDLSDERGLQEVEETSRREPGVDEKTDAVHPDSAAPETDAQPSREEGGEERKAPERFGEYAGPNMSDRARGGMIATRFLVERLWRLFLPVAALIVVLALVAAAFLLPDRHQGDIVDALEIHAGSPVTIDGVRLSKAAGGSLAIDQVKLAKFPSVSVRTLHLVPDWAASLRAVEWRFRARIDGLDGAPADLSSLLSGLVLDGVVSSIEFVDAGVRVGAERWGGFGGMFEVSGTGSGRVIMLESDDRSLTVKVNAISGGLAIETVGIRQSLAVFSAAKFDSYELKADVMADQLLIRSFGAAGYGGKITAQGVLITTPVMSLEADLTLSKVDGSRLMALAGSRVALDGAVDASMKMTAAAESASAMTRAATLDGEFSVDTGVLGRMDFGAALRERGTGKLQGGETRFESLAGTLTYEDRALDVRIGKLDAGALDANGRIRIAPDESLSGRVGAAVASGGRQIRVPVTVSGTVTTPVLETPKPVVVPIAPPKPVEPPETGLDEASGLPGDEIPVGPGQLR